MQYKEAFFFNRNKLNISIFETDVGKDEPIINKLKLITRKIILIESTFS